MTSRNESAMEAKQTYTTILETTAEILDRTGAHDVRVVDIARSSGITPGALYYFFRDKDELIEAANVVRFMRSNDMVSDEWDKIRSVDTHQEFVQVLDQLVATWFSESQHELRLKRLELLTSIHAPENLEKVSEAVRARFAAVLELLKKAQAEGWLAADFDSHAWCYLAMGMAHGRILAEIDPHANQSMWNEVASRALLAPLRAAMVTEG
jgi:AcrR family transcriptional regulator